MTELMAEFFDRGQTQTSQSRVDTIRNPASSSDFDDDRVERPSISLRFRPNLLVVLHKLGLMPNCDILFHRTSELQADARFRLPRNEMTIDLERRSADLVRKHILGSRSPELWQVEADAPVVGLLQ